MVAAAAVIFLPDLLDGKKAELHADFEGIPQAPVVIDKPESKPFPKEKLAQISKQKIDKEQAMADVFEKQPYHQETLNNNSAQAIDTSKIKITTLTKPSDSKPASEAAQVENTVKTVEPEEHWVVQLGSFRHEKNVIALVAKLEANDFNVFTKPIKTKNGTLTKVFVGPELVKSVLEKKLPKLKELTKFQGKVTRYKVTKP